MEVVAGVVRGGEGGEAVGLAGGDFAAGVGQNGVEGELEFESGVELESEFEVGEGGVEGFGLVGDVEAGGVGFGGVVASDEALFETDFPAGRDVSKFPVGVADGGVGGEDSGVLIAVGFESAELVVSGHVAPDGSGT